MATISEALAAALAHHQAGQLDAAEPIYRQIVDAEPTHAPAWHLLGVIRLQRGDPSGALELIGHAVSLDSSQPMFHNNLASAYQQLHQTQEAAASCRRALSLAPDYADAHHNLGVALEVLEQFDDAAASFRRALELKPQLAEAHNALGNVLYRQGRIDEAIDRFLRAAGVTQIDSGALIRLGVTLKRQGRLDAAAACYRRAVELEPAQAAGHFNLGNTFREQDRPDEAIACYRRALACQPNYADAANNLGDVLQQAGRLEEAIACFRQAVASQPDYLGGYNNLGIALAQLGRNEEAIACYRRVIELNPNDAASHCNLGLALKDIGRADEAIAELRRSAELDPNHVATHNNLGIALMEQGQWELAIASYARAVEINPGLPGILASLVYCKQVVCQWDGVTEMADRVVQAINLGGPGAVRHPVSPFCILTLPTATTAAQQLECARQWVAGKLKPADAEGGLAASRPRARKSRLSIGYLSADFFSHAVGMLIVELFEKHDRERFEIVGYSYSRDDGTPLRQRLVRAFDRFVEIKDVSFADAARTIAADDIDILVDLKGFTEYSRTEIVVERPAPIVVNYLGYPGTMGTSLVDYVLVDDFIVPAGQQPFFAERLVHLPGCYQANDSRREIAPHTPTRVQCGLPDEGFVFCSFNNSFKITPQMFGVWMGLLRALPGSVLWLLEANEFAAANLRREAVVRGVAPERLVFAPRQTNAEHLARHRLADVFLDTLPYNAHTTASDALWAGCPVLTIAGDTFAARVAGSLLTTVGLPELITTSFDDYWAMSLRLARQPELLAGFKARLASNRDTCGLFDGEQIARHIEQAYETMWETYAAGLSPRAFRIAPTSRARSD